MEAFAAFNIRHVRTLTSGMPGTCRSKASPLSPLFQSATFVSFGGPFSLDMQTVGAQNSCTPAVCGLSKLDFWDYMPLKSVCKNTLFGF